MTSRETVKAYQRTLTEQVSSHRRALTRLEAVMARRAEVIAAQDEMVGNAKEAVDQAVIDMAHALGPELTARLLGADLPTVRRLLRTTPAGSKIGPRPR